MFGLARAAGTGAGVSGAAPTSTLFVATAAAASVRAVVGVMSSTRSNPPMARAATTGAISTGSTMLAPTLPPSSLLSGTFDEALAAVAATYDFERHPYFSDFMRSSGTDGRAFALSQAPFLRAVETWPW